MKLLCVQAPSLAFLALHRRFAPLLAALLAGRSAPRVGVEPWVARDLPAKTEQTFEQDAAEKAKPVFRVKIYNRD